MPSHIHQYEFLHGCVLTALVRQDKYMTVQLIETNVAAAWSMYKVNNTHIHIKPSTSPKKQTRDQSTYWQFTFSSHELFQINHFQSGVVLVCAHNDIRHPEKMWRLYIEHSDVAELLDLVGLPDQDSLTAKHKPNARKLIVSGDVEKLIAPKALLDATF